MNPSLPEAVAEFAAAADKAILAAGGTDLARRAEIDPTGTRPRVAELLGGLGLSELDPRTDDDTAVAAAELCRVAGRYVVPYPVAGVLMGTGEPMALQSASWRVDHGDLFPTWRVVNVDGTAHRAHPAGTGLGSKLGPFVSELTAAEPATVGDREVAFLLVFSAWRILGAAERAVELAVEHVRDREQFGQALAKFQAVQFQLADAVVAVDGLRELARYTLWRVLTAEGLADPLALRLQAIDVARQVLRITQQLFGAAGLCDEYDISLLVRHIQPELRLPFGAEQTANRLFEAVAAEGFDGLFPQGGPR
jgi:acyl-CoA dehydrogenase